MAKEKKLKTFLLYFAVILAVILVSGCHHSELISSSIDWQRATKVEYRYGDSSLPPDYHRSYTITITENLKTISIDSYGKVLLTKEYPNTAADFKAFVEALSKKGIYKHKEKDSGGCTGGTSELLRLFNGGENLFDAYVYHCDGENGTLHLPEGTTDLIIKQIPEDVNLLIEGTMRR